MNRKMEKMLDWLTKEYFYLGKSSVSIAKQEDALNPEISDKDFEKAFVNREALNKYIHINNIDLSDPFDEDLKEQVIAFIAKNSRVSELELSAALAIYTALGSLSKSVELKEYKDVAFHKTTIDKYNIEFENVLNAIYIQNGLKPKDDLLTLASSVGVKFDAETAKVAEEICLDYEEFRFDSELADELSEEDELMSANWWISHDEEETAPEIYSSRGQLYKRNRVW